MVMLHWLKDVCEYLGGAKDDPPSGFPLDLQSPLWGALWFLLTTAIVLFSGQSSKFVYIDF